MQEQVELYLGTVDQSEGQPLFVSLYYKLCTFVQVHKSIASVHWCLALA